jgi:hypothetical protein
MSKTEILRRAYKQIGITDIPTTGALDDWYIYKPHIYTEEFAKLFWGNKWQHYLGKMITSSDPVEYLERFLEEDR